MSNNKAIVLQDVFLNLLRKERVSLVMHLNDNTQLTGTVKGFDSFTVILESERKQMMVYKNAINRIIPSKPVLM